MVKENEEKTTTEKPKQEVKAPEVKNNNQAIIIAVLATALVCVILVFVILALTGIIRFGGNEPRPNEPGGYAPTSVDEPNPQGTNTTPTDNTPAGTTAGGVTCYEDTRVQVGKLEFCLPNEFEYGAASDGAYNYNLVDDDGWAEVKVYAEKSSQTPTQFITNLSDNLKVTNQNYTINGTTWVRAEAGDYMLALSTKKDNLLYTIFFTIKLDSDNTDEAWSKILSTPVFVE